MDNQESKTDTEARPLAVPPLPTGSAVHIVIPNCWRNRLLWLRLAFSLKDTVSLRSASATMYNVILPPNAKAWRGADNDQTKGLK